jgi:hypothetical protein
MDNQVTRASQEEGKALADMYKGAKDLGKVDQQVHDRLLQDAIKDHHSELNMDVVRKSMVEEAGKLNDKRVNISTENYGVINRTNEALPLLNLVDKGKLYDPSEGWKAIQEDDKKREQDKQKGSNENKINFWDGGMGLPTLFKQINDASNKH